MGLAVKDEPASLLRGCWTPGQRFVESEQYKSLIGSGALRTERARVATSPVEVWTRDEVKNFGKATTITAAELHGTLVTPDRLPGLTPFPLTPPRLLGMVNRSTTDTDTVEWVTVATFDNQAVEVAEEAAKPQSDLTFAIVQSPVQTIAHWIAATRQALADAEQAVERDRHLPARRHRAAARAADPQGQRHRPEPARHHHHGRDPHVGVLHQRCRVGVRGDQRDPGAELRAQRDPDEPRRHGGRPAGEGHDRVLPLRATVDRGAVDDVGPADRDVGEHDGRLRPRR